MLWTNNFCRNKFSLCFAYKKNQTHADMKKAQADAVFIAFFSRVLKGDGWGLGS